ncbi:MAG: hypothetical protein AAB215_08725 [Planctomycetota bacterium]
MIDALADLCASFAAYALLATACIGWGRLAALALGMRFEGTARLFHLAWLGFSTTLALFQGVHFLLPLAAPVSLSWLGIGILAAVLLLRRAEGADGAEGGLRGQGWFAVGTVLIASWLALRAMAVPANYDSGLYHFQAIRWMREFPIVPGLANLHDRLALNLSFHGAAAAWDVHPFWGHGRNVALSFVLLLLSVECLRGAIRFFGALRRGAGIAASDAVPALALPLVLCLPLRHDLASPNSDLATLAVQLAFFLRFARFLEEPGPLPRARSKAGLLFVLAATAGAIKGSNLVYAFAASLVVLVRIVRLGRAEPGGAAPGLSRLALLPAAIACLWIARNVATSGYPAYPSIVARVNADWAISARDAGEASRWISGWARRDTRAHGGDEWEPGEGISGWLLPWLNRIRRETVEVVWPVAAAAFLAAWQWRRRRAGGTGLAPGMALPLAIPIAAGALFWFATAPAGRFANALFWTLSMSVALPLILGLRRDGAAWASRWILAVILIVAGGAVHRLGRHPHALWDPIRPGGYQPIPAAGVKVESAKSGLKVHTPVRGRLTWDAPLPAGPHVRPDLRLRGVGLGSGFTVQPK